MGLRKGAAVLSPDGGGVGMAAMAAPLVVLYVLSIGVSWAFSKGIRSNRHLASLAVLLAGTSLLKRLYGDFVDTRAMQTRA